MNGELCACVCARGCVWVHVLGVCGVVCVCACVVRVHARVSVQSHQSVLSFPSTLGTHQNTLGLAHTHTIISNPHTRIDYRT